MVVNFGQINLNVLTGTPVEKASKVIPFHSQVSIRKIKPGTKFKKKVSQVWISTIKYSFSYIIGYYMLKNNLKKIAGFYALPDGKNLFMEFLVVQNSIIASWLLIQESPEDFLSIEGKVYDAIFGNTSVSNHKINITSLHKELVTEITPIQMILVAFLGISLLLGGLYLGGVIGKKEKVITRKVSQPTMPEPLTVFEERLLRRMVYKDVINQYNDIVLSINKDQVMESASIEFVPNQYDVTGNINIKLWSYYPFDNAVLEEDTGRYIWQQSFTVKKEKSDISSYDESLSLTMNIEECLGILLKNDTTITSRSGDNWKFRVNFTNYNRFINLMNKIYNCPISINLIDIKEESQSIEGELYGN